MTVEGTTVEEFEEFVATLPKDPEALQFTESWQPNVSLLYPINAMRWQLTSIVHAVHLHGHGGSMHCREIR
jgi:hypothetical protein